MTEDASVEKPATADQGPEVEAMQSSSGRTVGFTCGVLHALEDKRAAAARAEFERVWPEVSRRRYRSWLTA